MTELRLAGPPYLAGSLVLRVPDGWQVSLVTVRDAADRDWRRVLPVVLEGGDVLVLDRGELDEAADAR